MPQCKTIKNTIMIFLMTNRATDAHNEKAQELLPDVQGSIFLQVLTPLPSGYGHYEIRMGVGYRGEDKIIKKVTSNLDFVSRVRDRYEDYDDADPEVVLDVIEFLQEDINDFIADVNQRWDYITKRNEGKEVTEGWLETFFEISMYISMLMNSAAIPPILRETHEAGGNKALFNFAQELSDEFESIFDDSDEYNEYYEQLDSFLQKKIIR